MTRQDAIDILVGVITTNSEEENEALDIAIKALEQEPSCRNTRQVDLISGADMRGDEE